METDLFRGIVPFVAVAEARSFRGAATQLGVSAAAVSKAVLALEHELGFTLLIRGARAATLTREGEQFFARCRHAVTAVRGAREALDAARREPEGELTLSLPFIANPLIGPALALLHTRHPRLRFRLFVTDALSRFSEEPIDVAVRIGPLVDSALIARHLRATRLVTVAAPSYLALRGTPRGVDELAAHACLVLVGTNGKPRPWQFRGGPHAPPAFLAVDHGPSLLDAALAGLGVTQVLDYMATPLLRDGRLVAVLTDEAGPGPDIHAVCAPGRRATPRVRAAFDAFADAFAERPPTRPAARR